MAEAQSVQNERLLSQLWLMLPTHFKRKSVAQYHTRFLPRHATKESTDI